MFGVPNDEFGEEVKAVVQPAEGVEGVRGPAHPGEDRAAARQRQRAIGREQRRFLVRVECVLELVAERGDMPSAQRVLVALERGVGNPAMSSTRSAFWAWSRFSDWSKMMLRGPSITSEVISSPRCAGRQCITSASGPAAWSSASFTW